MYEIILPPILGAIIGYFTNWLAIKMLFLPRKAKYIGKVKLPLTPGLIPKERKRLSSKIAKVCEENILSAETIKENIFTESNKEKVYLLIESGFNSFIQKDYTLEQFLAFLNKESFIEDFLQKITFYIEDYIKKEENQTFVINAITKKSIEFLTNSDNFGNLKDNLKQIILKITLDEDFKQKILQKKLNELLNEKDLYKLKVYITKNTPKFLDFFIEQLNNNESLNENLKNIIKKIIEENVGSFALLFLNYDKIYKNIKKSVITTLNSKENQNKLAIKAYDYITDIQNKQISELYKVFPKEIKAIFDKNLSLENIESMLDKYLNEQFLLNLISNNTGKIEEKLKLFLAKFIKNEFSKLTLFINNIFEKNKDIILNFRLNKLLNKIKLEKYKEMIFNYIESFIKKQGDNIISNIHIADMVENKINSFKTEQIEEIIISVTKKELNTITVLGGVLGFVIGLVPVLSNLFV